MNPLHGWMPRNVKAKDIHKVLEGNVNPFTDKPHTAQYEKILQTRKNLPVYSQMEQFLKTFQANQITILIGETGSGKTTQIPQLVVYSDLPQIRGKMIACTQPRRLTTKLAAKRVADEMDVQPGKQVGYSLPFEDMTERGTTFLKYMTDDTLLREMMTDPDLSRYSTIIIDEAHERSLATDILMGLLKALTKKRSDLKLIVMSATLDGVKFQKFFKPSGSVPPPLFKIPVHKYPVDVFYTQEPEPDYVEAAIRTVMMIHRAEEPGDILLFLTGEEEIEYACRHIKAEADDVQKSQPDSVGLLNCIPLHSSLSPSEVQRVFERVPEPDHPNRPPSRKVIISTDIAETALSIDGIVYVIDPGFSKQVVFNPRIRIESILASPISKANAQQRAGHAGYTRPGKCFRLYTEKDFMRELEENAYPEILRANLASMVLQLLKIGVHDFIKFEYIDKPAPESLMRALELLNFLAAIDDDGNMTPLGGIMADFPLEPQLAKALIVSNEFKCSNEILTIVTMLSMPNVFVRPPNKTKEADAAKALLSVPGGDHLTLLNVYNEYQTNGGNQRWARENYLDIGVLQQAQKMRDLLRQKMEMFDIDIISNTDPKVFYINIRQALAAGFFMQAAHREGKGPMYSTVKEGQPVALHPSCGLDTVPEWVIYHRYVLTSRPYIRTVTEVRPEWLLQFAPDYYDLSSKSFPEGETKRALKKIVANTGGRGAAQEDRGGKKGKKRRGRG